MATAGEFKENKLRRWISGQCEKFLGFSSDELVTSLITMRSERELREHVSALFGPSNAVGRFIERLVEQREAIPHLRFATRPLAGSAQSLPENVVVYRKGEASFLAPVLPKQKRGKPVERDSPEAISASTLSSDTKTPSNSSSATVSLSADAPSFVPSSSAAPSRSKALKTQESVAASGEFCGCQATLHKLLCNCLSCGRITCEKEGSIGSGCLFCHEPLRLFRRETLNAAGRDAFDRRDRLIEFQKARVKRTTVFDDQEDFFEATTSRWASNEERNDAIRREKDAKKTEEAKKHQISFTLKIGNFMDDNEEDDAETFFSGPFQSQSKKIKFIST